MKKLSRIALLTLGLIGGQGGLTVVKAGPACSKGCGPWCAEEMPDILQGVATAAHIVGGVVEIFDPVSPVGNYIQKIGDILFNLIRAYTLDKQQGFDLPVISSLYAFGSYQVPQGVALSRGTQFRMDIQQGGKGFANFYWPEYTGDSGNDTEKATPVAALNLTVVRETLGTDPSAIANLLAINDYTVEEQKMMQDQFDLIMTWAGKDATGVQTSIATLLKKAIDQLCPVGYTTFVKASANDPLQVLFHLKNTDETPWLTLRLPRPPASA